MSGLAKNRHHRSVSPLKRSPIESQSVSQDGIVPQETKENEELGIEKPYIKSTIGSRGVRDTKAQAKTKRAPDTVCLHCASYEPRFRCEYAHGLSCLLFFGALSLAKALQRKKGKYSILQSSLAY